MSNRDLLTRDQVARKLSQTADGFSRKRKGLEAEGFPPAVLGRGRGARWDPAAIDAWLDQRMPKALRSSQSEAGPDWEARLIERLPQHAGRA
jgi:predicted DNA-binding transcriptional regulator AlpA